MTREEIIKEARGKIDLTRLKSIKPHLTKFFKVSKIADEPSLNKNGFWKKSEYHRAFDVKPKNDK